MCRGVSRREHHFHRFFTLCEALKNKPFAGCLFFSPSAGRLWASSHVDAASHPYRVTLGSGLASMSWRRTKCLACVQEAWCGANCPSEVRRSTVGPQCRRTFCVWSIFASASFECVYVWKDEWAVLMFTGCEIAVVFSSRPL